MAFILFFIVLSFALPLSVEIYKKGKDNVLYRSGQDIIYLGEDLVQRARDSKANNFLVDLLCSLLCPIVDLLKNLASKIGGAFAGLFFIIFIVITVFSIWKVFTLILSWIF